jgi:L-rhamnose isomerase
MVKDNLTLSSPDDETRAYWIRHGIACRRIAAAIAKELNDHVVYNVWIPDGLKDVPADRLGPRKRLKESLDEIFAEELDGVIDCVESKLFGIGLESYTVGSNEFYLAYTADRPGVYNLLDNGHYHPTEYASDKIPSLLVKFDKIPLHVTRGVRWDSDHVVLLADEVKDIAAEIVRCGALDKVLVGLDFFDASINRVAAWVTGTRNMQKALLIALLTPWEELRKYQDNAKFTDLMVKQETLKTYPFGAVWEEFCVRNDVPIDDEWLPVVKRYEEDVLLRRK